MNPTPKQSLIEKSINWIVDARGDSYGDERERLRYYEAHSAMLTVQTYLMPVIAAIVISIAGKNSIAPVLVLTSIPTILAIMGLAYLRQEGVSLASNTFRKPLRTLTYFLAYATLPIAILSTYGPSLSFLLGMISGLISAAVILFLRARKEAQA